MNQVLYFGEYSFLLYMAHETEKEVRLQMREEKTILDGPITALIAMLFLLTFYGLFPKVAEVARPLDELPTIISSVVHSGASLLPSDGSSRRHTPAELQTSSFGENIAYIPTRLGQRQTLRALLQCVSLLPKHSLLSVFAPEEAFLADEIGSAGFGRTECS